MRRVLLWCLTIVAAFELRASAATLPTTRVPVTSPVAELAARVEMDPDRDHARFVHELIRRLYSPPPTRAVPVRLVPDTRGATGTPLLVDLPLTPEIWSTSIFRAPVPAERLLAAIVVDRRAALLCRGLLATDDETLVFYGEHPALLTFLYEQASGAFAAFGGAVHVHDGRVTVPGGPETEPLWDAAVQARVTDPQAFIRALFLEPEARSAYVLDVLDAAGPAARAFALGLWIGDVPLRTRRFVALHQAVRSSYREWHVSELPFTRPLNDLAILLFRIRTAPTGEPQTPALRRFWAGVLHASETASAPGDVLPDTHTLVDAAWLIEAIAGDMYSRGDRLDQVTFGQRVFGGRPDAESDTVAALLREMPARRMLLFGLERVGVTDPTVYQAALAQTHAVGPGAERFWTLAQLQGAMAIVVRMHGTRSLDAAAARTALDALFALPLHEGEFRGALLDWFESALAPHLPRVGSWQSRVVAGVAGGPTPGDPRVEWEGQAYRLDLAFAERHRIEEIQSHQDGPDLDAAFAIVRLARRARSATTADEGRSLAVEAQQALATYGLMLVRPPNNVMAPGVPVPRDGRDWLARAADDLARAARSADLRRVGRAGDALTALGDMVLGHAMLSLVYAVHLGDPGGPALLGGSVALRHDFGFSRRDGEGRARGPWAMPRQDFQPGVPWHVVGSLIGMDVGLAPLNLRRLSMDALPSPPRLQSIEREAFAVNAALLNARDLTDTDRDRIAAAIERGRQRVRRLTGNPDAWLTLERELGPDGWRGRSLRWVLQNAPDSLENHLSLADLLVLGDPAAAVASWGTSGILSQGCVCTRFPGPRDWRILSGRSQMAMMAAVTVDMNLELASRLAALRLPAALLPSVLSTAMQDYVDRVGSVDPADREPLVAYPRTIGRGAMADHVAAAATLDGPLVAEDQEATER